MVLRNVKVMSFKDLMEARAKRTEKDAAEENKDRGKRGRKRRTAAPEADTPQPKVARISEAPEAARATVQMSATQITEDVIVSEPWRAPVARMW